MAGAVAWEGGMNRIGDEEMKASFLAWQCRIRQLAMRDHGGRPGPGMRPKVLTPEGAVLMPAMTVLIIPEDPRESTAFFRFQVQKTPDPRKAYESVLAYLQADYFHLANRFSDEMTALFPAGSATARGLVKAGRCLLEFSQDGQVWRMSCNVRTLPARSPARQATLWHNRAFNPDIANDAVVIGLKPDWRSAAADPMPPGAAAR